MKNRRVHCATANCRTAIRRNGSKFPKNHLLSNIPLQEVCNDKLRTRTYRPVAMGILALSAFISIFSIHLLLLYRHLRSIVSALFERKMWRTYQIERRKKATHRNGETTKSRRTMTKTKKDRKRKKKNWQSVYSRVEWNSNGYGICIRVVCARQLRQGTDISLLLSPVNFHCLVVVVVVLVVVFVVGLKTHAHTDRPTNCVCVCEREGEGEMRSAVI